MRRRETTQTGGVQGPGNTGFDWNRGKREGTGQEGAPWGGSGDCQERKSGERIGMVKEAGLRDTVQVGQTAREPQL